ncbi:hypothetical protein SLEP1_g6679 [Rubroshorea leprosula]|uniref:Uncharacterized protein n=1 Tax=Rubroshorea leprosula TaxID=152421 RepID=A0AAV5I0K5_9ROSI|nr:hypothetical protein SLEP1_g6679 [Rubroshorea leprosula]
MFTDMTDSFCNPTNGIRHCTSVTLPMGLNIGYY